jgi:hypothetical protein
MKTASVPLLLIVLTGCDSSNEKDIANCRQAASHVLPAKYEASELDEYQKSCMASQGYHFTAVMSGCSRGDAYQNAACYVRRDAR